MTTRKTSTTPALRRSKVLMLVTMWVGVACTVGAVVVAKVTVPTSPLVWGLLVGAIVSLAVTFRLLTRNVQVS